MSEPSVSRVEVSPGVQIAVHDWGGQGPLVLLHHANGFCAATFSEVARRLSGQAHLIAMDARGHGDSSTPVGRESYNWQTLAADLRRVAEHVLHRLALPAVDLAVGHSFGGSVTLGAAASSGQLFKRALLIDPVVIPPAVAGAVRRANPMASRARKRRRVFASRQEVRQALGSKALFANFNANAFEDYVQHGFRDRSDGQVELKCSPETEATVFETGGSLDLFALAPQVEIPVVVQWAQQGNFSRGAYERLVAPIQDALVETVPAGHLVPMERPDLVAARIRELLGQA